MRRLFAEARPDVVIHYAEQPSAPYSMMNYDAARRTLRNNLEATFNVIWACIEHAPDCHIVKLGTMGEYGTPNIDIEEGWIYIRHKGREDRFLFPRAAGSLYHTTKVLDTDLLWFYVRLYGLRVTDLMQGPVYGLATSESDADERLSPELPLRRYLRYRHQSFSGSGGCWRASYDLRRRRSNARLFEPQRYASVCRACCRIASAGAERSAL